MWFLPVPVYYAPDTRLLKPTEKPVSGGGANIPLLQELLKQEFESARFLCGSNPEETVVIGGLKEASLLLKFKGSLNLVTLKSSHVVKLFIHRLLAGSSAHRSICIVSHVEPRDQWRSLLSYS
jgi:hypothetical protein